MKRWVVLLLGICLLGSFSTAEAYGGGTLAEKYPQVIAEDTFSSLATAKITQLMGDTKETRRYTIELVRVQKDMRTPPGQITFSVDAPTGLHYTSMTPIYVSVLIDGNLYRRAICYFRLHVFDKVVVSTRRLMPEQKLTAADVCLEEREVTSSTAKYLNKMEDAQGQVLDRLLPEGVPLTESMLRNPIVLEAGSSVHITANVNGIIVRTEGVTLQRGRSGDTIRVRNANSSKILRVRVIDAANVEIIQ